MRSSFTNNTVAKLEHDLCELLRDINDYQREGPPIHCIRAGVLGYHRESDKPRLDLADMESEPALEWLGKCEYCHRTAWPLLDMRWEEEMETLPGFCCIERQKLCMALVQKRPSVEAEQEEEPTMARPGRDKSAMYLADALLREKKARSMSLEMQRGLRERSGWKKDDDGVNRSAEPPFETTNVLSFRLGAADQECWVVNRNLRENENVVEEEEEEKELTCDHKPTPFGICHQKDGKFQQKFYLNGKTFVNMFPDGSAQLFYPSGHVALIVVVTKDKGRACVLYDENLRTPHRPIRAIFQSNGMATCYHKNGNIWLSLSRLGGQCLDETSVRVRRWTWRNLPPPHLPPLFLSINRNFGLRVLAKDQVFVSFLANGQQARCSVGSCSVQCKCTKARPSRGLSVLKDELFVLAARIKIHLCIYHLNWSLIAPLHQKTVPSPSICAFGKRLLEVSANMLMSQHERIFIQGCLQDCL
ncbi:glutamate-rich protein 6 isoform X2 [Nerophis lumbriciformis]|uniref:glutamate-rich protein 6 isoform X2 n=1 Tax=Nerophis lumbriciformis TaxID=546530 RepID=UPI002AE09948|nr:glutamate-rich protein 6 isoform X2 [Nerophis lumbriciformis]